MMLGKRPRPPMKRTTSMTEFTLDLNVSAESACQPLDPHGVASGFDQRSTRSAASSTRSHRRISADFVDTAPFLRVCSLCKRRLIPGHDIYMYRGDSAFCSLECRQQQMTQDERKDKCSLASKKGSAVTAAAAVAQVSAAGETVAAG